MKKKIVVHGGRAHLDDVMALAFITACVQVSVIARRDPTEEELDDSDVYCIDVGGRYQPHLLNFDNKADRDSDDSAMSLVLKHMGIYDKLCVVFPYLQRIQIQDQCGPAEVVSRFGINEVVLPMFADPFAPMFLSEIGSSRELTPDSHGFKMLARLGKHHLKVADEVHDRVDWLEANGEIVDYHGRQILVNRWVGEDPSKGIELWQRIHGSACVAISKDTKRVGSWLLYRFPAHHEVDFRRIKDDPCTNFVHESGFLASVKAELGGAIYMAKQAIVEQAA